MEKSRNIQNMHLYNNEDAKKRHIPPKNPGDNALKDGIKPNKK
jgi:hypothetical protein